MRKFDFYSPNRSNELLSISIGSSDTIQEFRSATPTTSDHTCFQRRSYVIGVVFDACLSRDGRMMVSALEKSLQAFGVSQSLEIREVLVRIPKQTRNDVILLYRLESRLKSRNHPHRIWGVGSTILRIIFTIVAKSGN